jgi:hypothetical protein
VKGTVYTGIVYLPKHPQADMHGLLRCVVRTSGVQNLASALRVYDIPFHPMMFSQGIWAESVSITEQYASSNHYGEVLVCELWQQYLKAENYQPVPKGLKK